MPFTLFSAFFLPINKFSCKKTRGFLGLQSTEDP